MKKLYQIQFFLFLCISLFFLQVNVQAQSTFAKENYENTDVVISTNEKTIKVEILQTSNPAIFQLQLQNLQNRLIQLELKDAQSETVIAPLKYFLNQSGNLTIDLRNYQPGTYSLQIWADKQFINKRIETR